MKLVLLLAALAGAAFYFKDDILALTGSAGEPGAVTMEGDVYVLNASNFNGFVETNDHVLVKFVAPWCGHCKTLAPKYAQAATELKGKGAAAKLATVDATENKDLASRFGVRGYPTIVFFKNRDASKSSPYEGGRETSDIVNWVNKKTGPPAVDLADAAALETFKKDNEVVVVYTGPDGAEKDAFIAQASDDDEVTYGILKGAKASVTLYKQFDEGENKFSGSIEKEALAAFVSANSIPTVMSFAQHQKKIFDSSIADKGLLFVDTSAPDFEKVKADYTTAAKANKGKIVFATVDKQNSRVLEFFGIDAEKDLPVFFVLRMTGDGMTKYKHDGPVNKIAAYLEDFVAGKAEVYYKSEEPPAEPVSEGLTTVVGKTFAPLLADGDKCRMIFFYAPWCGHCKTAKPELAKAARKMASIDNVVIAKMDSTQNDCDVPVQSFPTIFIAPKGATDVKSLIPFKGDRTSKGFLKGLVSDCNIEGLAVPKKNKAKKVEEEDSEKKDDL